MLLKGVNNMVSQLEKETVSCVTLQKLFSQEPFKSIVFNSRKIVNLFLYSTQLVYTRMVIYQFIVHLREVFYFLFFNWLIQVSYTGIKANVCFFKIQCCMSCKPIYTVYMSFILSLFQLLWPSAYSNKNVHNMHPFVILHKPGNDETKHVQWINKLVD